MGSGAWSLSTAEGEATESVRAVGSNWHRKRWKRKVVWTRQIQKTHAPEVCHAIGWAVTRRIRPSLQPLVLLPLEHTASTIAFLDLRCPMTSDPESLQQNATEARSVRNTCDGSGDDKTVDNEFLFKANKTESWYNGAGEGAPGTEPQGTAALGNAVRNLKKIFHTACIPTLLSMWVPWGYLRSRHVILT